MEAYTGFAQVYDTFMDNIPYGEWSRYLIELLKENGLNDGIVLELGCGTGNITERLAKAGYDMIGIDNSEEMLSLAIEKLSGKKFSKEQYSSEEAADEELNILYLLQDMREFELFGTVAGVVSICDSMNYITEEEELLKVFRLVNNYLDTRGLFIFDMNTLYKYKYLLADKTIAENRENSSFIWENYFDEKTGMNQYDLAVFVREEEQEKTAKRAVGDGEVFYRFQETHYQKAYSLETVKELLEKAGMEFVAAYDAFTKEPPKEDSERIYIIAREGRQEGKYYTEDKAGK